MEQLAKREVEEAAHARVLTSESINPAKRREVAHASTEYGPLSKQFYSSTTALGE
jgi:hypothetical protein